MAYKLPGTPPWKDETIEEKAERKGWSQRKKEKRNVESEISGVVSDIKSSRKKPKYNIKGELIGVKKRIGGGTDNISNGGSKDPKNKSVQGFDLYSNMSRRQLKGAAKQKKIKWQGRAKTTAALMETRPVDVKTALLKHDIN